MSNFIIKKEEMKKFSRIISLVLVAGMATSSMQMIGMERLRSGWKSLTERLSPSKQLQNFKNTLSCVWTNNCSPQDMKNIKWGLAAITALIVGGGLVSRALPSGELTVAQLMDTYMFHPQSKQVNFLNTLRNYVTDEGIQADQYYPLLAVIEQATADDFAMLHAAHKLLSSMSLSSKLEHKKDTLLRKINSQLNEIKMSVNS
jgi:hypothetical protein